MSKELASVRATSEARVADRDEKLRQMKKKYDDLVIKCRQLADELVNARNRLDSMPNDSKAEM